MGRDGVEPTETEANRFTVYTATSTGYLPEFVSYTFLATADSNYISMSP